MLIVKLIISIIVFSFGIFCMYACFEKSETFKENESLIFSIGSAFVLIAACAMTLALFGQYRLRWCLLLYAFFCLILLFFTYKNRIDELKSVLKKKSVKLDYFLLAIVLVSGILYCSMPTYYMWSGRDYGLYYINAVHTAKTGSIDYETDTWLDENYEELSDTIIKGYPAFYSSYDEGISDHYGDLNPQFLPLYWCLLSVGYSIAGNAGLYAITALMSVVSLAVLYIFMQRFFGKKGAVLATALLAFCPAQIWGARITQSEQMIQLLFFLATVFFGIGWQQKKNSMMYLGTLFIGLGCFCRMDNYLMGLAIFAIAIYAILFQKDRVNSSIKCVALYTALMMISIVYGFWKHYGYYRDHWEVGVLRKLLLVNLALLAVTIFLFLCNRIFRLEFKKNYIAKGLSYRRTSLIISIGVGLILLFFYYIRPLVFGINYFPQFCYYFCPLMLIFFVVGIYHLTRIADEKSFYINFEPLLLWIVIGSAYCLLYSYSPSITMDHYFMSRRWVPVNFPFIICIGVVGYFKLIHYNKTNEKVKKIITSIASTMMLIIGVYIASRDLILVYKVAYKDIEKTFAQVAEAIPKDAVVLTDKESIASTLRYVYDKNVYWINWEGSTNELQQFVNTHDDVYYLGKFSTSHFRDAVSVDAIYVGKIGGIAPESCYDYYPKHNQEFFVPANLYHLKSLGKFELDMIPEVDTFASTQKTDGSLIMSGAGIGFYGPYCNLEPGEYEFQMELTGETNSPTIGTLEIVLDENVVSAIPIESKGDMIHIPVYIDDVSQVLQTRFVKETTDVITCSYLKLIGE